MRKFQYLVLVLLACFSFNVHAAGDTSYDPVEQLRALSIRNEYYLSRGYIDSANFIFGNPVHLRDYDATTLEEANQLLRAFYKRHGISLYFQLAYWVDTPSGADLVNFDNRQYQVSPGQILAKAGIQSALVQIVKEYKLNYKQEVIDDPKLLFRAGFAVNHSDLIQCGSTPEYDQEFAEVSFVTNDEVALIHYVKTSIKLLDECLFGLPLNGISHSFQAFVSAPNLPTSTGLSNLTHNNLKDYSGLPAEEYNKLKTNIEALTSQLGLNIKVVVSSQQGDLAPTEASLKSINDATNDFNNVGNYDGTFWMHVDQQNGKIHYDFKLNEKIYSPKETALAARGMTTADVQQQLPEIKNVVKDAVNNSVQNKNPALFNEPETPAIGAFEKFIKAAKLAKETIADLQVPHASYKDEKKSDWFLNVQIWDPIAGGGDAIITETKSIPELVTSAVLIFEEGEFNKAIEGLKGLVQNPSAILDSYKDQLKSKQEIYTNGSEEQIYYEAGSDGVVVVVTILSAAKQIKVVIKKIDDLVKGKVGKGGGGNNGGDGNDGNSSDTPNENKDATQNESQNTPTPDVKMPSYKIGSSDGGPGTWDNRTFSGSTDDIEFQKKVTGAPDDTEYVVKGPNPKGEVKFDGYDPEKNVLLDAKRFEDWPKIVKGKILGEKNILDEARRQINSHRNGAKIEWHISSEEQAELIQGLFTDNGITDILIVSPPKFLGK